MAAPVLETGDALLLEDLQGLRAARQLGEQAEFHGAEQGLRGPEGQAGLEDGVGGERWGHGRREQRETW